MSINLSSISLEFYIYYSFPLFFIFSSSSSSDEILNKDGMLMQNDSTRYKHTHKGALNDLQIFFQPQSANSLLTITLECSWFLFTLIIISSSFSYLSVSGPFLMHSSPSYDRTSNIYGIPTKWCRFYNMCDVLQLD